MIIESHEVVLLQSDSPDAGRPLRSFAALSETIRAASGSTGLRTETQDGVALIVAIMAMLVLSVLSLALVLATSSETMMAAGFQRSVEARYAAEAAVARAASDAQATADWSSVLNGLAGSSFADGAPSGARTLADGTTIDLDEVTSLANCGRAAGCTEPAITAITAVRPWGLNNPRWRPYAYGPFDEMAPAMASLSPFYVMVSVGDDAAENDDRPLLDGGAPVTGEPENAGADVLVLRGEAFGRRGSYACIEATLMRRAGIVSWRVVR